MIENGSSLLKRNWREDGKDQNNILVGQQACDEFINQRLSSSNHTALMPLDVAQ